MVAFVELPAEIADEPDIYFGVAPHWSIEQGRALWRSGPGAVQRFALEASAGVIAAAAACESKLHPTRLWAFVEVVEANRRRGIGTVALNELRDRLPQGSALRCKTAVGSAGEAFARSVGLQTLMETRTLRVEVPLDRSLGETVAKAAAPRASDQVVDAWRRYYEAGHRWDPTARMPLSFWRTTLGTEADVVLSWPADGPILGIAIVGTDGAWTGGAVERDDPGATEIASRLLSAASAERPVLDVEFDDWMTDVAAALGALACEEMDHAVILGDPV